MTGDLTKLMKDALTQQLEDLRNQVRTLAEPLTEQDFWAKPPVPGNSFGHLVLHLTGNLNHFVGAQLGGTGYVRDREREFTEPNPPSKSTAMADLDTAVATFREVVQRLTTEDLAKAHPSERLGKNVNALIFLVSHFALHRGQMSYIARLAGKRDAV